MPWTRFAVTAMVCAVVFGGPKAAALETARSIDQYQIASWTTQRGVPHDHINAIAQTPDGYLWIATRAGLARFDGVRFTVFDRRTAGEWPSDNVTGLLAGRDGALWMTHAPAGLTRLQGGGAFQSFRTPGAHGPGLAEDADGAVWLATDSGLRRFQAGKFTLFAPPAPADAKVWWVVPDGGGSVWFGTEKSLGRVVRGKPVTYLSRHKLHDEEVPWALRDDPAEAPPVAGPLRMAAGLRLFRQPGLNVRVAGGAHTDAEGFLYLPTVGGLARYRADELRSWVIPAVARHPITAMLRDREGNVWLGLRGLGLCRFGAAGFEEPGAHSPLRTAEISAIMEDREGSLWVGTQGAGLWRLADGDGSNLPYPEPVSGAAQAVLEDSRGGLWVGVRDALLRYANGRWSRFDGRHGLQGLPVRSMAETADGAVWFGAEDGFLHQYAGGVFRHYWLAGSGSAFGPVTALHPTRDGALWIGTAWSGAARWAAGALTQYRVEEGLSSNRVTAITADSEGAVWIGTADRGVNRLDKGVLRRFTTDEGLAGESVTALHAGRGGVLWVGTAGGGLSRWRGGAFRSYTHRQGLEDDAIFGIAGDKNGCLWLGSPKGVFRVRLAGFDELDAGRGQGLECRPYDESDGLRSRSLSGFNQPSMYMGASRLWLATEAGVSYLETDRPERPLSPPAALVEQAFFDGKPARAGALPVAPPGPGRLRFVYTAATLRNAERVRFRYLLEGFDREWQAGEARREVQYTGVPPGQYLFRVEACLPAGPCGPGASFAFRLEPRFYQTRWFLALCFAAAGALLWGVYRLRVRMLRREFAAVLAERTRIAGDLHDGLLQNLTGVLGVLDAAGSRISEAPAAARQSLNRGRFLLRECVKQARQSVWDIRQGPGDRDDIRQALEAMAAEFGRDGNLRVELAMQGDPRPLTRTARENVLLIAREAVVNAVKHAGAGSVTVEANYSAQCLRLSIQDNGRGFSPDATAPEHCFGLRGMRERAERIGAALEVRSAPGAGCEVLLLAPLRGNGVEK